MEHMIYMDTPIGTIGLTEDGEGISGLRFQYKPEPGMIQKETSLLQDARIQLEEYFGGKRKEFQLPLSMKGTPFQQSVWKALRTIPYGELRSYKQIAQQVNSPRAFRAVGMANHVNPVSIIVPCHRVVGADGNLTGYGGGMDAKKYLLDLERKWL